jgi:3-dehydroquinate dehydratase-2
MPRLIYILNGPNLNLLGEREPELYGRATLAEVESLCKSRAAVHGLSIDFRQSNFEGALIESVHEARKAAVGIIINPAGLTFTSVSLLDALKTFDGPKIEFHITQIHKRDEIYHRSLVSKTATAVMAGLGPNGYGLAIDAMAMLLAQDLRSA